MRLQTQATILRDKCTESPKASSNSSLPLRQNHLITNVSIHIPMAQRHFRRSFLAHNSYLQKTALHLQIAMLGAHILLIPTARVPVAVRARPELTQAGFLITDTYCQCRSPLMTIMFSWTP